MSRQARQRRQQPQPRRTTRILLDRRRRARGRADRRARSRRSATSSTSPSRRRRSTRCTRSSAAAPRRCSPPTARASASSSPTSCARPVSWNEIPTNLKNATVAIEDQRFYKNNGVDLTGIFRSAVKDLTNGAALQGGSTITMQLMRNLYLGGDQHTLKQKIIEAKLALEYDETPLQALDPHRATSTASPTAPSAGRRRSACRRPRGSSSTSRPPSSTSQQAALLAGLPQAPSQYNPFARPSAARQRRNEVLAKMAQLHYISDAQAAAAEARAAGGRARQLLLPAPRGLLLRIRPRAADPPLRRKTVEQGGLKVYTTIDLNMQRLARKAIAEVLDEPEDPASAIVTINPANGDIEAMAESESYEKSQYNLAADGHRQPGSTFKAIDLADALSRGVDPNSTYYLSHTLEPGWLPGYPNYEVKTFEGTSLNRSINLVRRRSNPTTPSTPSSPPTSASRRSPKWPTRWGSPPTLELSGRGARRADARRDAAGNGRRLRDARRRRLAQHPDRDHQGRVP